MSLVSFRLSGRTGLRACPRLLPLAVAFVFAGCSRQSQPQAVQRVAVLRFENVGPNPADDWMGRALSEVISAEIAGNPGMYAISSARLHSFDRILGPHPISAPGISTESGLTLAAGANRTLHTVDPLT